LGDAEATKKMQLQHTVCACTGLPRQDMEMIFEYDGVDAARRLKDLEHMKPTTGFGETFQYSNPLVTAGGYIAAHAAYPKLAMGDAYDKAMRSRVLDPMGMRATTFDLKAVARANHALPHGRDIDTALRPMPLDAERVLLSVRPAGGAWSNAKDMARWAIVELRAGLDANDKRVFAEDALLERRKPRVKMSDKGSYGLALASGVKNGLWVVGHGGATMGFSANLELFVEHDLGIVVLSNGQGSHDVLRAVTRRVLELGFAGRAEAGDTLAFSLARAKEQSAKNAAKRVPPDAELYDQYAGSYAHPTLGAVTLSKDGVFDAGEWKSKTSLIRDEDTTLLLQLVDPPLAGLEFAPKVEAGNPTLVLRTPQQSYVFARK
jgi:CubicO group peptidase (beta-lactamase class C family)